MKLSAVLACACAVGLFTAGTALAQADQMSEIKRKIEALEQTTQDLKNQLQELEKEQKDQAEDVEKIKDKPSAREVVRDALAKDFDIGAHFKLFLADYTDGERNDVDQDNDLAAGIDTLWLYFSKGLTDWLSFTAAPRIDVLAAATPALGADIDRSSDADVDIELDEAYFSLRAPYPYDVEAKVGAIYPYFSNEYASKTWWHEQYHGNNALVTLQDWQSTGIEVYKNFDFPFMSLPVYFYPYLNGEDRSRDNDSRFTDNNGYKHILLHLAPEKYLFGGSLKLLGSLGWGRWDEDGDHDSWQYALGADIKYKSINISGEYLARLREDWELADGSTADADDEGWYVRALYTLNEEWRILAKYSDVDLFFPAPTEMLEDNYKTLSLAINYWLTPASTIIPQVEYVDAERSGSSETLEYLRWTLGWRTTF